MSCYPAACTLHMHALPRALLSLPSHPPAIPLAVFPVTLRATIPRFAVSRFQACFQVNQREVTPKPRVSSTHRRSESFLYSLPPLRLSFSPSHPPSYLLWISMNSKDNFATGKPPPSLSSLFPPFLHFCRLAFWYHPLSRLLFSTLAAAENSIRNGRRYANTRENLY